MSKAEIFKNRIIGYAVKPADQFQANPANWRKHPQRQRDAVNASLREVGWIAAVIENVQTGNLIDGHERVWQALRNNEDVPYLQVDLSPAEEALALAVFDPITGMAETDAEALRALLDEVNTGEAALQTLLAEMADISLAPSLDDLSDHYGEPNEQDFWPVIRVVVPPDTMELWQSLLAQAPGDDEAARVRSLLDAVDASLLGAE